MSTSQIRPKRRAKTTRLGALSRGFDSITFSQSNHFNKMIRTIERRNTVAEAWIQTGQMMKIALSDSEPVTKH